MIFFTPNRAYRFQHLLELTRVNDRSTVDGFGEFLKVRSCLFLFFGSLLRITIVVVILASAFYERLVPIDNGRTSQIAGFGRVNE